MYVKAPKPALAGFEAGEADSAKSSSIFFEHNFFEGYFLFSEFDWKDAEKPFFQKEKKKFSYEYKRSYSELSRSEWPNKLGLAELEISRKIFHKGPLWKANTICLTTWVKMARIRLSLRTKIRFRNRRFGFKSRLSIKFRVRIPPEYKVF
jgi:hypothetical protein